MYFRPKEFLIYLHNLKAKDLVCRGETMTEIKSQTLNRLRYPGIPICCVLIIKLEKAKCQENHYGRKNTFTVL